MWGHDPCCLWVPKVGGWVKDKISSDLNPPLQSEHSEKYVAQN